MLKVLYTGDFGSWYYFELETTASRTKPIDPGTRHNSSMIIRQAANQQEIERAIENYWIHDPPANSAHAASDLDHWLGLFEDWPAGFFICLDDQSQQIVGVASAAVHPPQWILTNFFVHPDYQGRGIGRALFSRALAWHEGCTRFAVHASQHPAAQGLYLGAGMYAQPYSIVFKGAPALPAWAKSSLVVEPCSPLEELPVLNTLDQRAFGFTRDIDHRWWAKQGRYFLAKSTEATVGYFRVAPRGIIGPLVMSDARWMPDALDLAIREQVKLSSAEHTLFVPGANTTAIEHLHLRGYRYIELELLLSSQPMPGLANVIFHDTDRL
jgi:GNAT superfamily N-acetyltransferase